MPQAGFVSSPRFATFVGTRWKVSTWWPNDSLDTMQQSLLRILMVAHQERLELPVLVANLAEEHRGRYRRRLLRFARRLEQGTPLVDALEQTPDVLSDPNVLAIRFATQMGSLGPTYQSLLSDADDQDRTAVTLRRQTLIYSIASMLFIGFLSIPLTVHILPMVLSIQDSYALFEPDRLLQFCISVGRWTSENMSFLILAVLGIAFLNWSTVSRRFFRRLLAGRWVKGIAQTRRSQLLQLLSIAVDGGRPISSAVALLANHHFDRRVRHQLVRATKEIEQGADAWSTLTAARLLTPQECTAIADSMSAETRAWTLQELAKWKLQGLAARRDDRIRLLQPLITLLIAMFVLTVGVAMIGFLSQMVQSLAEVI